MGFLLITTNFYEFKLQAHITSKLRDDLVPRLFTENMRFKFIEMTQAFEETINPTAFSSSPLAICMEDLTQKTESTEMQIFTSRLESASDPDLEKKRLNFWLASIRKLSLQMKL